MDNQEKLLKQIKSLSDSIRQKNRALKLGIGEREKFLETTFKPVTTSLRQIAQNIKKPSFEGDVILPISKYEEMSRDDYEDFAATKKSKEFETGDESETAETDISTEKGETTASEGEEETTSPFKLTKSNVEEETTNPLNLSKLATDIVAKGELGRKYLLKMLHSTQANRQYHTYGARIEEDKGLMIGDSKIDINEDDDIIIGNKTYKGTTGLFELIFKSKPNKYNKKDLTTFKNILEKTNAHRRGYSNESPVYRNRSIKYTTIISQLFPTQQKKGNIKRRALSSAEINILHKKRKTIGPTSSGKGLMKNLYNTNIIYYSDINKLVDRMRLIHEAIEAGHTGLNNEWVALVEELRNRGIIA